MYILRVITGTLLIILSFYIGEQLKPEFLGGGIILLISIILIDFPTFILRSPVSFGFHIRLFILMIQNKQIRFSMSYQYRIKIKDSYLLIKNSNFDWYQFVGGKYKRFKQSEPALLRLKASEDTFLDESNYRGGDIALIVPARRALAFLEWFNSRKDREIDHWREFYEELIIGKHEDEFLDLGTFPYIQFRYIDTVKTPLRRSPAESGWSCWEYSQFDVLEPVFNEQQYLAFENLKKNGDSDYIKWASDLLIDSCGYNQYEKKKDYQIGIHTKWIKNLKWSKE